MIKTALLIALLSYAVIASCQEHEQQLENLAERDESVTDDDMQWQQLHNWQNHPLNVNAATEEELSSLPLLTALQIHQLIQYRNLLGPLIDLHELQAIPGWDIATIRRVLPYIAIAANAEKIRLGDGEQKLLVRVSNKPVESNYPGSGLALMTRYTYKFRDRLQYGVTTDKDAGERSAFDFYSFHFFARNLRKIKTLALGDYTVRLGQGLIQWQGLAFKKSSSILSTKRQAAVLQPYSSPGEYNFYRGAAVTLQRKRLELTLFSSLRKFDATLNGEAVSSLVTSGYHRTELELSRKNNLPCITYGGSMQWRNTQGHFGFNTVHHHFSDVFQPSNKPYDRFSAAGSSFYNYSVDYGYTIRNLHFFGEAGVDKNFTSAQVHGLLASLHSSIDVAVLYRAIDRRYEAFFSNAFTENSLPVNEKGFYLGMVVRPVTGLQLDVYADVFQFPWLTFKNDAPFVGQEYLFQMTYTPGKNVELYTRYRFENKNDQIKKNWRTQLSCKLSREWQSRSRVEAVTIGDHQHTGYLFFQDLNYKPAFKPFSFNTRLQYIETDSYDSRIYAMEHLLQYSFAAPAFFNKGWRAICTATCKLKLQRSLACVLNLALTQTINAGNPSTPDEQKKTSVSFQVVVTR